MKPNFEIWECWASVEKKKKKQHASSKMGMRVALAKEWLTHLERGKKIFRKPGCWAPWLSLVAGSLTTESLKPAD